MRVAVISDIHANYHALEAVLAEVTDEAPDEIWCLGDVVGYGPEPNRCCELVAERADALPGRQPRPGGDRLAAARGLQRRRRRGRALDAGRCSPTRPGSSWPRSRPAATRAGVALFHGSPIDPVWDYVLSEEGARAEPGDGQRRGSSWSATAMSRCGLGYDERHDLPAGSPRPATRSTSPASRWLLNPGSVGQPRGGDPRAAWLMLDFDARRAWFRRTEYPIELTQAEIRAAGLPEALAVRLAIGQ